MLKRNTNEIKVISNTTSKQTSSFVHRENKYISYSSKLKDQKIHKTKVWNNSVDKKEFQSDLFDVKIPNGKDNSKSESLNPKAKKLRTNPSNYITKIDKISLIKSPEGSNSPSKRAKNCMTPSKVYNKLNDSKLANFKNIDFHVESEEVNKVKTKENLKVSQNNSFTLTKPKSIEGPRMELTSDLAVRINQFIFICNANCIH